MHDVAVDVVAQPVALLYVPVTIVATCTRYPVIGDPPVLVGAVHVSAT